MILSDLLPLVRGTLLTPGADGGRGVTCGYACDLLSWVMAHGRPGMAWVTVQTHLNVIAVASLAEMAAVILPEGLVMEGQPLLKAQEEGVAVVSSPLSAYAICAALAAAGLPA